MHLPLRHGLGSKMDAVELLSAAGTFLRRGGGRDLGLQHRSGRDRAYSATAVTISLAWAIGATMQIAAGLIALSASTIPPPYPSKVRPQAPSIPDRARLTGYAG